MASIKERLKVKIYFMNNNWKAAKYIIKFFWIESNKEKERYAAIAKAIATLSFDLNKDDNKIKYWFK